MEEQYKLRGDLHAVPIPPAIHTRRHNLLRILTAASYTAATVLPPRHFISKFPNTSDLPHALPLILPILTAAAYTVTTIPLPPRHIYFTF